jgi:hypothetical protein
VALAIRPGGGSELTVIAISKEQRMRKLIATIAATLALAGAGLATYTATSDAPADAGLTRTSEQAGGNTFSRLLPYIEQDNVF